MTRSGGHNTLQRFQSRQAPPHSGGSRCEFSDYDHSKGKQRAPRANSLIVPHWLAFAVPGGLAIAFGFLATLYLLPIQSPMTPAARALTDIEIRDARSLLPAVKAAGLTGSTNLKGSVDELARHSNNEVAISGWAAELGNSSAALTILVFVAGKAVLTMRTSGRHPDVVAALGASDTPGAANVAFRGIVSCQHGQNLLIVAVTDHNSYGYFGSRACP